MLLGWRVVIFSWLRLLLKKKHWDEALELVNRSLIRNWHNHKTRQLKVSILRKLGKVEDAENLIEESLKLDRFNFGILFEKYLLTNRKKSPFIEFGVSIPNIHTYIEFALEFAFAGLYEEAIEFINIGIDEQKRNSVFPMALYYKAWFEAQKGDEKASSKTLMEAAKACPDYCFPNQTEAVSVLEWAKKQNPTDAKAPYYLGNFWYNYRQYEDAITNWELSVKLNDTFPTVHRNLALAYFNKNNDSSKALYELEHAFELDGTDTRVLMELDQLYKRLNIAPEVRLLRLNKYPELIEERDDLCLERAALYNQLNQFEKAFKLIMSRKFHPWEGGEGKVIGQYVFSLKEMAKKAIQNKEFEIAVDYLNQAQVYPENLGEGKLKGSQENEIFYWLGNAFEGLKDMDRASVFWEKAATGMDEPSSAIFYNDQKPETIYFQGLALVKLGRKDEASIRFNKLIRFGKTHLDEEFKLDYFAISLPDLQIWDDDLTKRNRQNCMNLIALGNLGLENL